MHRWLNGRRLCYWDLREILRSFRHRKFAKPSHAVWGEGHDEYAMNEPGLSNVGVMKRVDNLPPFT